MLQFRQFKDEDWEDFNKLSKQAFPRDDMEREIYRSHVVSEGFVMKTSKFLPF